MGAVQTMKMNKKTIWLVTVSLILITLLVPSCAKPVFTSRIAFTSDRNGNDEIYVMDVDGSNQTNLTNNPALTWMSAWSPNGNKIVFGSHRDGNMEVYVMDADGSNHIMLTNNSAFDSFASWSP